MKKNPERDALIVKMLYAAKGYRQIGEVLGISTQRVHQIAKRIGVVSSEVKRDRKILLRKEIKQMRQQGKSFAEIAIAVGCSRRHVHDVLYRK